MYYPFMIEPIYKDVIWGGRKLSEVYNRVLPSDTIGESWEITCRKDAMSVIRNGEWKGYSLLEAIKRNPKEILGSEMLDYEEFPLLVKIIDARDRLSVQVHPDDAKARELENVAFGKSEVWYVIDADEGARLIAGLKAGTGREDLRNALRAGRLLDYVQEIPVKAGDVINIPAGTVHAIGGGILLTEVQQNSDTTYRVYDWERKGNNGRPRPLHIKKSMEAIDFSVDRKIDRVKGLAVPKNGGSQVYFVANQSLALEKVELSGKLDFKANGRKFYLYTCIGGHCIINTKAGEYRAESGSSFFIPAAMGDYSLTGGGTLIRSYVPDIETDFIRPLLEAGYSMEEILENTFIESFAAKI